MLQPNLTMRVVRKGLKTSLASPSKLRRTASTISPQVEDIPAIFDIFDAPARLGESIDKRILSNGAGHRSGTTTKAPLSQKTRLPPYVQPTPLLFDGPARPRRKIIVTTRSRPASTSIHTIKAQSYKELQPIIFDGPSRPHQRVNTHYKAMPYSKYLLVYASLASCVAYNYFPVFGLPSI